jgi:hypothetical protein
MEPTELIRTLDAFPDQAVRAFESAAVELVMQRRVERQLLKDVLADRDQPAERRYAAFFSLGTLYRRSRDTSLLIDLIDANREEFQDRGTFAHLEAMAFSQRDEPGDRDAAFRFARKAREMLPRHPGILHSFAAISLKALDAGIVTDRESALAEARTALDEAMSAVPKYAKFEATLARWYLAGGRADEARSATLRAMDLEDSSHVDYSLRIADYISLMSTIELKQAQRTLEAQVDTVRNESERIRSEVGRFVTEVQIRYLELLGFFSVIIGLVLSGVQIATGMLVEDAARILLVVAGAILVAFTPLASITGRPWRHGMSFLGLGTLLIILALMAGRLTGSVG